MVYIAQAWKNVESQYAREGRCLAAGSHFDIQFHLAAISFSIFDGLQADASLLAAASEVATGGLLLVGLFSRRRNFMLTLMYWRSVLPARYWSAEAGPYHRMVSAPFLAGYSKVQN